jgi:hypothetical protein
MGVHGVDALPFGGVGNMKQLYELVRAADRILNY